MLKILLMVLFGALGGVVGGMGMGGGTVLIPLLTLLSGVTQHLAQSVNLFAFIPMSVVAIIIHARNKLIDVKSALMFAPPAVIMSVLASLVIKKITGKVLAKMFGAFLLVLGVIRLISAIKSFIKNNKDKKDEQSPLQK